MFESRRMSSNNTTITIEGSDVSPPTKARIKGILEVDQVGEIASVVVTLPVDWMENFVEKTIKFWQESTAKKRSSPDEPGSKDQDSRSENGLPKGDQKDQKQEDQPNPEQEAKPIKKRRQH